MRKATANKINTIEKQIQALRDKQDEIRHKELEYERAEKLVEAKTEPEQHITRTQTLRWHDARKDIPEMNRVCLIKVPDRPWCFDGKGDIKQDVVYLDSQQVFNEGELPYVFRQFGPGTFAYNEVTEWAYLDE